MAIAFQIVKKHLLITRLLLSRSCVNLMCIKPKINAKAICIPNEYKRYRPNVSSHNEVRSFSASFIVIS